MIAEFFKGKTLLITGTTGFLGKVLLERVLWEFPEVKTVRLLARPSQGPGSKNQRARRRLVDSLKQSAAFSRLRARHPDFEAFLDEKIEVFSCDLLEKDLGISPKERTSVFDGLDAVIHIAASVSWDERFDYSVRINTLAAAKIMEYAKKAASKPRFVHISSAFVHGQRNGQVFEEPFDPERSIANEQGKPHPFDLDGEIAAVLKKAKEVEANAERPDLTARFHREAEELARTPKYAAMTPEKRFNRQKKWHIRTQLSDYGRGRARHHGWIDSYTFSKAMAEMVLSRQAGDIPLTIVRPPGITSALQHPVTGWLEGYHLVEPLIEGVGRGMIKSFPGDPNTVVDTVPVDYVINLILAACARPQNPGDFRVFQVGTSHVNPITLREISKIWLNYFAQNPIKDAKGAPIKTTPPKFFPDPGEFVRFYQEKRKRPIALADGLIGRIPVVRGLGPVKKVRRSLGKLQQQIDRLCQFSDLYSAYTVNSWRFMMHNSLDLLAAMSEEDKKRFHFDASRLDWTHYWTQTHIPGMRRYVIQES